MRLWRRGLSTSVPRRDIFGRSERSVKRARLEGPFELELGGTLPEVEVCWEEWGPSDAERAVLLFPSFSMSSHAKSTVEEPTTGWYEPFVGPRKAIDTDRFRIVCPATLGAPFGSTSPLSVDPASGRPYGKTFPQITPFDMVRAARLLLEQLRIPRLHSVIGGSLGGNLALQFVSLFPDYSRSAIAMSFTGRTSPLSVGLRHIQRAAILADPDFRGGDYREHNCFPHKGLSIARQLAMLVYKSWDTFNQRFSWTAQPPYGPAVNSFEIESYLSHQGAKFARDAHTAYDPNCYLLLSKASDLTNLQFRGTKVFQETAARVGESYLDAVLRIRCNLLLFGITSDIVIPISEQTEVFNILRAAGRSNVRLDVHNSPHGHDAFLLDENYFIPKIRQFLASVD